MTTHLLAVQEDDWGSLRLLKINPTTGALTEHRNVPFANIMYDDGKELLHGPDSLCVLDLDNNCAFYSLDGELLFEYAGVSTNLGRGILPETKIVIGSDYTFYALEPLPSTLVKKHVISPFTQTVVITTLFDSSLYPADIGSFDTDSALLVECTDGLHAYGASSQLNTLDEWRMASMDVWTPFRSYGAKGMYGPTYSRNVISNTASTLRYVVSKTDGRNINAISINKTSGLATLETLVTNAYTTEGDTFVDNGSLTRESTSVLAEYVTAVTGPGSPTAFYASGGEPVAGLGAAGSGFGGVGKSIVFTGTETAVWGAGMTNHTLTFEMKFTSVSGVKRIVGESAGADGPMICIKDGHLCILTASTQDVLLEHTQVLTTGVFYRITVAVRQLSAGTTLLAIAIDGSTENVVVAPAAYIGASAWGHSAASFAAYTIPSFQGELGGMLWAAITAAYYFPGREACNRYSTQETVPNIPIVQYSHTPIYKSISHGGGTIRDSNYEDGAGRYFLSDGTPVITPIGDQTFTLPNGYAGVFNGNTDYQYKIGPFLLHLNGYVIRVLDGSGATVSQYLGRTNADREFDRPRQNAILLSLPEYSIAGTTTNEGAGNADGVKLRLMNDDSTQVLATAVSASGAYSFPCLTTTPKTVIAKHTDLAKPQMIRSGLIPS